MNVEQMKLDYVLESWKDEVDYANRYPSSVVVCHSYRRARPICTFDLASILAAFQPTFRNMCLRSAFKLENIQKHLAALLIL